MDQPAADRAPLRVAFWTLGCRLNQVDTEGMKARLHAAGAVDIVPWAAEADVYVLNSCTVTGRADQECRRLARQVKRRHPGCRVVVAGCYAQTQPERLHAIPEIDGVVGNTAKEAIAEWLPELLTAETPLLRVEAFPRHAALDAPLVEEFDGRSRAFVKVQDGCDLRCSYCLIWRARGPARSRPVAAVLRQVGLLRDRGFPEVVLAGVHLGAYGRDLDPRTRLVELLDAVLGAFPDLRFRLGSIHPDEVTDGLLALLARHANLRPHLHLSVQHGADSVLRRMRRPYGREEARRAVLATAAAREGCGIGADLIVGFPGETEEEFRATRDLVAELPFTYLHVFRYSPRPGTPAAHLSGRVHPETVTARARELRTLARHKARAFAAAQLGQRREAVAEAAKGGPGWRQATTDNYLTVHVPDRWPAGRLLEVADLRLEDERLFAGRTVALGGGG